MMMLTMMMFNVIIDDKESGREGEERVIDVTTSEMNTLKDARWYGHKNELVIKHQCKHRAHNHHHEEHHQRQQDQHGLGSRYYDDTCWIILFNTNVRCGTHLQCYPFLCYIGKLTLKQLFSLIL